MEHGFVIDGAWMMADTNQFVWLLRYKGPAAWEEKEAAYYASAGRVAMAPNPARLIARAEERFIERVMQPCRVAAGKVVSAPQPAFTRPIRLNGFPLPDDAFIRRLWPHQ